MRLVPNQISSRGDLFSPAYLHAADRGGYRHLGKGRWRSAPHLYRI